MKIIKPSAIRHTQAMISMCLCACLLAGCISAVDDANLSSTTPLAAIETPTATIEWFPASSTPTDTPVPAATATPIALEGLGVVVVNNALDEPADWSNLTGPDSGVPNQLVLMDGTLIFAINQSPARFITINQNILLTDSAISVRTMVNRCSAGDTYGILFKANTEQMTNRLALNCNGQFRVEQLREGSTLPLSEWLQSGDVPQGGPANVIITIWSAGNETRIFLNNHYQLSVFDKYYPSGSIGFFASGNGDLGMNVQFSDLLIQRVDYASPTPTAANGSKPIGTPTR